MTRINCIPPAELTREHLLAEYRELPRTVALANAAWRARRADVERRAPARYVLGTGHVLFFYDKLSWVRERFRGLVEEMLRRGYRPAYRELPPIEVGAAWMRSWAPDAAAMDLNRARIAARLLSSRNRRKDTQ